MILSWFRRKPAEPSRQILDSAECPSCGHFRREHYRVMYGVGGCNDFEVIDRVNSDGTIHRVIDPCECNLNIGDIDYNIQRGITWETREQRRGPVAKDSRSGVPRPPAPPTPQSMTYTRMLP